MDYWYPLADRMFAADLVSGDFFAASNEILDGLQGDTRARTRIRIVSTASAGLLASRPVVMFPDGGPGLSGLLSAPWPNPSGTGSIRFTALIPDGQVSRLTIHDLKGRLIRSWSLPSGNHFLLWSGTDDANRRVSSGTYILRLQGSGEISTHKVVLLH